MNQMAPPIPKQHKKSKKWLWWVILSIIAVAVLGAAIWWLMGGSAGNPKDVASDWLTKLSTNQADAAYQDTATDFKTGTNAEQFDAFLEAYPIMTSVKEVKFSGIERATTGGKTIETLDGTITSTDGSTGPIKIMLIKEDDQWRVYNVDLRGL